MQPPSTSPLLRSSPRPTPQRRPITPFPQSPSAPSSSLSSLSSSNVRSIYLVDQSANEVLDVLESLVGKKILRQQDLPKTKINFSSDDSLSKDDLITALESLLSMNGVAVLNMGPKFLKAVPTSSSQAQSPQILQGSSLDASPSQKICSKIFSLSFLSSDDAKKIISPLLSSQQPIVDIGKSSIMVTDALLNLQKIESLLLQADQPQQVSETIKFYPLKYVNAPDIKERIEALRKGRLVKYLDATTIEADKTTNQLIVVSHPNNLSLIENLITSLDVSIEPLNRSEVFYIKHGKAEDIANLIKALVQANNASSKDSNKPSDKNSPKPELPKNAPTNLDTSELATDRFSSKLTLEPDQRSNSIVAYGTTSDLTQIRKLIDQLDIILAQVRIEVIIAEVTLTDGQASGLSSFGINLQDGPYPAPTAPNTPTPPYFYNSRHHLSSASFSPDSTTNTPMLTLNGSLKHFGLQTVFNLAEQNANIKVLSAPTIMTTHNQKGKISVGQKVPVVTSTNTNTNNASSNITQSTEYRDIGIELEVKPLIGQDGFVQLEIKQKIESSSGVGVNNNPIITSREAESFVSVLDNDTIVLGGLQSKQVTKKKGKVFILGDLPILGNIFRPKQNIVETKELVIFIKPHVILNNEAIRKDTNQNLQNFQQIPDLQAFLNTGKFPQEPKEEKSKKTRKSTKSKKSRKQSTPPSTTQPS